MTLGVRGLVMGIAIVWVFVLGVGGRVRAAHAEGAPPLARSLRGDALAEYEGGRALFGEGDFAGALGRFRKAAELSSDPRLLWDMAACEQKLGHIAKMATLIDKYLGTGGALLTEADRRLATRLESSVRGRMCAVMITTTPAGVDVLVDDEPVGKTPLEQPLWVEAGTHRVAFKKAGFKDALATEEVTGGGGSSWTMTLEHEAPPPTPIAPAPPPKRVVPALEHPGADAKRSPSHVAPLLLIVAGALQIGGGGVLVGLAENKFGQLRGSCSPACNPSSVSPWPTLETVGDVLFVMGGVSLAAGVVWWISLPGAKSGASALWIAPAPGGAAMGGTL
jgi:hypothetical protein